MFGSNKPIDEKCTNITGQLTYDPSNQLIHYGIIQQEEKL